MILEIYCQLPVNKPFDYLLPKSWDGDIHGLLGRRVAVSFGFRDAVGVITKIKETSDAPIEKLKPISELLDSEPVLTQEQIDCAFWLSRRTLSSVGEALFAMMPAGKGIPKSFKGPEETVHYSDYHDIHLSKKFELTPDQKSAAEEIHSAIYDHSSQTFVLYGIAAAGKTEVYLSAINDVLSQGKSALYLVPEISLANQSTAILKERFGENAVLFWNSDVTPKERMENWWRIKRGEYPIVVGARSAALAPLANIGAIIVDEEHDMTFKEDRKPRFHARDVAIFRAKQNQAVAILGTATPSLEILYEALEGRAYLLELNERATLSSKPRITMIDTRKEKTKWAVSDTLRLAVEERIKNHHQCILFLNKRGYLRFLKCPHCDWVAKCPDCDIAVVAHKTKLTYPNLERESKKIQEELEASRYQSVRDKKFSKKTKASKSEVQFSYVCHYCSKNLTAPSKCPVCGHQKLFSGGYGTQRLEKELQDRFPWAKILRWDHDAVLGRGSQKKVYDDFNSGKYDILIGTQMVSQGFNFPGVTLVGVIDADAPLHFPDFRASEKAFQSVMQVAGRAGREMVTGDVYIQTREPEHPALEFAHKMDYRGFAESELKFREDFHYPPFSHLVMVSSNMKVQKSAEKIINQVVTWIEEKNFADPVGILGPTKKKRARKGGEQTQVLLKVPNKIFDEFLTEFSAFLSGTGSKLVVDVDPESVY